jgi:Bifunctional DNA primase/polymerase, N-terminal/Primase C terminal 1 (PriCT-1)
MSEAHALVAALDYASRGWPVFPLHTPVTSGRTRCSCSRNCKNIGKHPRTMHGLKDATTNSVQIERWWGMWPDANVGIATGSGSEFFALDVDPRHDGGDTLAQLEMQYGTLPTTVISRTGGGGEHRVFRHVEGIRNIAGNRLGPGLDVRGDGGYVVAPPSIHESGRPYAWDIDYHPDETLIAKAPDWLVRMAITPATEDGSVKAELPANWRRLVADGVREGQRNAAVARLAGHLLRKFVDPLVTLDLVRAWNAQRCRPPLDDAEVVRTVDSIAAAELRRRA